MIAPAMAIYLPGLLQLHHAFLWLKTLVITAPERDLYCFRLRPKPLNYMRGCTLAVVTVVEARIKFVALDTNLHHDHAAFEIAAAGVEN